MISFCCSLPSGPRLQGATARSCFLCWPQAFKEPSPSPSFQQPLSWGRKRLQNYSFFLYAQAFSQLFFVFFLIFFFGADYQRRANGGFFRPQQRKRPGRPETAPFPGRRLRFFAPWAAFGPPRATDSTPLWGGFSKPLPFPTAQAVGYRQHTPTGWVFEIVTDPTAQAVGYRQDAPTGWEEPRQGFHVGSQG